MVRLNGHWLFPTQMDKTRVGFVYVIRDDYMKEIYFGKKLFQGYGKMNKGVESNWKSYLSSSKYVQMMLKARPRSEFSFIVLDEFDTKGGLAFAEVWAITTALCPLRTDCGNTMIGKIGFNVREGMSQRFKERYDKACNWESFEDERQT